MRRTLRQGIIQIILVLSLTDYIMNDAQLSMTFINSIKPLIFYTHQNFILICDFIIHKLPAEACQNVLKAYLWFFKVDLDNTIASYNFKQESKKD